MAETLNKVGEYVTDYIILTSKGKQIDISSYVLQTVIYEDVFSNIMTGHMVITDAANLITTIPVIGTELITVKFRTPTMPDRASIIKDFYISAISERQLGDNEQNYVFNLIAVEGFLDSTTYLTSRLTGSTSDLIQKIYDEHLNYRKDLYTEEHTTKATVLPNHWSALKTINWLATGGYREVPNTLFFEGNKNFYCISIDALIRTQREKIYGTYTLTPNATSQSATDLSQYFNIKNIAKMSFFDVLKGQDFGYYANKLITHDVVTKQYKEWPFDYAEKRKGQNNLEGIESPQLFRDVTPKDPNNYRRVRSIDSKLWNDYTDRQYQNWASLRNSLLYEAQSSRYVIEVHGRTDIEVGKVIQCDIPKSIAKDDRTTLTSILDPQLSGKYLITHIRHEFALGKHIMLLEIMKDSYRRSPE